MTLDPKFNKLPKVTNFGKASAVFQQSYEEGFRTLTGQELVSEIKDYIEITGIELAPITSGVLTTPSSDEIRTMEVVGVGPWTHPTLPGGSVSMTSIQKGKLFWDGAKWSLRNVVDFTVGAIELAPIAGGALPTITTTGQDYKMQISGGLTGATFIDPTLPGGQAVLAKDELGLLYFNSTTRKWSLENKQELPRTPTTTEYGDSEELAAAQKLVTDLKRDFDNKISVISNEEFLYAIVDKNEVLLWGKRRNGSTYDCDLSVFDYTDDQIARLNTVIEELTIITNRRLNNLEQRVSELDVFKTEINNKIAIISNEEFSYAIVSNDGVLLWGKRRDGSTYDCDPSMRDDIYEALNQYQIETANNIAEIQREIDKIITKTSTIDIVNNPEFLRATEDKKGALLEGVRVNGERWIRNAEIENLRFNKATYNSSFVSQLTEDLKNNGFKSGAGDWSDEKDIALPISRVSARINLVVPFLPTQKKSDYKGYMEYWDIEGNYFKKPIIINPQGDSSMAYVKKNFAIDLDDGSKIKFGKWVAQDSWHLKAHYTDAFKSNNNVAYDMFEYLANNHRPYNSSRVWDYVFKQDSTTNSSGGVFKTDYDSGARGFPDGFPTTVYHNGEFYGVYMFNLKKHRDNYRMERGNTDHIHLDGYLGSEDIFNDNPSWHMFEIRNPNPRLRQEGWELLDMNGNKYDGDSPTEPSDDGNSGKVKAAIMRLAESVKVIKTNPTKEVFESYFTNLWMFADYLILANVVGNGDSVRKNWQWVTYDGGKHWTIAPYDWDGGIGVGHLGNWANNVSAGQTIVSTEVPMKYFWIIYQDYVKARYQELKAAGFLTIDTIFSFYKKRIAWIGYENFEKEFKRWEYMPPYRPTNVDESNWTLKSNSIVTDEITYNDTTQYNIGDEVVYGIDKEKYVFVSKGSIKGIPPFSKFYLNYPKTLGFYNSINRVYNWLEARIKNLDNIYKIN